MKTRPMNSQEPMAHQNRRSEQCGRIGGIKLAAGAPRHIERVCGLLAIAGTLIAASGCNNYAYRSPGFSAVSFTIDDGDEENWVPLFTSKGIVGTAFIITGPEYMTTKHWSQLLVLQSAGWEIGGHTRTHPDLTSLDQAGLEYQIGGCKDDLIAHGITDPVSFAYPYSDFDPTVEAVAHEYFLQSRAGTHDVAQALNYPPYYMDELRVIDGDVDPLEQLEAEADAAAADTKWMIVVLHTDNPKDPVDVIKAQKISTLIDYIQIKSLPILTMAQGANLARSQ